MRVGCVKLSDGAQVLGDINATDTFDELSKLVSIREMFDIPSALRGIRGFASSFTPVPLPIC